jgi:hypothetical protein
MFLIILLDYNDVSEQKGEERLKNAQKIIDSEWTQSNTDQ